MRIEDALAATRAAVEEGIVPGGGVALLNVLPQVHKVAEGLEGDERTGAMLVARALEEPLRQIAINAGVDGSVVVDAVKRHGGQGYGYNAVTDTYGDMAEFGIIDPTKVTRSALQNAASIASMALTTESLVCDIPTPPANNPASSDMGGMY